MPVVPTTINTCALWGTTSYVNSWLSINILVIIISLLAIAVAYSMSSFMPANTRSKMRGFVRFEMIQMIVSILIIGALLAFSAGACKVSTTISQSLSHQTMSPFQYADYYVGAVSLGTGLTLLSNIYSTSISYAVEAAVIKTLPSAYVRLYGRYNDQSVFNNPIIKWFTQKNDGIPSAVPFLGGLCDGSNWCDYERLPSLDFSQLYSLFSAIYLDVYSPIIIIALGMLFIQFLALPIMQYTAFTVVLPVAIAMRSIAFFGTSLGDASNALIAIAIALYIIYPMTVAFDSYAIGYVFSSSNPSAQYIGGAFTVNTLTPASFFQPHCTVAQQKANDPACQPASTGAGIVWSQATLVFGSVFDPASFSFWVPGFGLISSIHLYTDDMAQFIFQSILLFALNISITVGLAVSIHRALKSGLGEAGRFW